MLLNKFLKFITSDSLLGTSAAYREPTFESPLGDESPKVPIHSRGQEVIKG